MKTALHLHGRGANLFQMHPFNALFSLIASLVLLLLVMLLILLSVT